MAIKCCKGCVEPERHLGCHDTCKKYQNELAKHIEMKRRAYPDVATVYGTTLVKSNKNKTVMHRKRRGRVN